MNKFIARYTENGINKSFAFNKETFNEESAAQWLDSKGIKNFFFFFEPDEPTKIGDNSYLFSGEIGWEITFAKLLPYFEAGNEIIIDSFGGDLWEGLKMYDGIRALGTNPSIGILGSCASAATFLPLATSNSWTTPNSRFLIHNPWSWQSGDDEDMRRMADDLEKEKLNIANIYAIHSNKPVEEILELMKKEVFLNSAETKAHLFVNEIKNDYKQVEPKPKTETMAEAVTEEKMNNMFSDFFNKMKATFKTKPQNIVLQDANGTEIDFGEAVEDESQIVVGIEGVTVDGAAANEPYTMPDGKILEFEAGTLTKITEPESEEPEEDMEALKAENEELKQKLADAEAAQNSVLEDFKTFKAEMKSTFKVENSTPPAQENSKKEAPKWERTNNNK